MGNDVCFLLTLLCGDGLLKVALKVAGGCSGDVAAYPMEPENRANLAAMLPKDVRETCRIVAVDRIFEVIVA